MRKLLISVVLIGCTGTKKTDPGITNTAPAVAIVAPESGYNAIDGTTVSFLAYVTDSESSPGDLFVSWASDVDGDLWAENADEDGNSSFETGDLTLGAHTITATVFDPEDAQASANVLLAVYDPGEPPVVALLTPDDDDFSVAGESLDLSAIVEDPDDSLSELMLTFDVYATDEGSLTASCDDQPDEEGVGHCSVTIEDEGLYSILVTATDPQGNTDTDERYDYEVLSTNDDDGDGDGFTETEGDCDDDDPTVHPEAPEISDGIDNNCDGSIDEGTDNVDDDGDGLTELEGDCDDTDGTTYPGAFEYLDGVDNDCDGAIDDGTDAYDDDGDCACEGGDEIETCMGSISTTCDVDVLRTGDCDDADEDINPDAAELCDAIDNDCDDLIDEADPDTDGDGDGYSACDAEDCDDSDAAVHPGAEEVCNDTDDDCDDVVDEDSASDAPVWFLDADGDSYGSETSTRACSAPPGHVSGTGDCDDTDSDVNPGATEVCDDDDTDEDCSGSADGLDAEGMTYWYLDLDGDGYPTSYVYELRCDPFGSYIAGSGLWDCDDSRPSVNPGMDEVCDDFYTDEDCDGEVNEPGAEDGVTFYRDSDGDGYGDPYHSESLCVSGDLEDYDVTNNDDCCDLDAEANPDASEYRTIYNSCFSYDWDCDGAETKRWTATGSCGLSWSICSADPQGWRYSAEPDCGEYDDWVYDCSAGWSGCSRDFGAKTQECR